ncbi:ATP-binding protein [Actinomadura verrucosospora]|uniref:Winged helix-turn-helix domain-containing protein n=1 Tax=Actinomadura verrucosospora TaxID=46165 RepID=A0A7D3VVR3_ACTVE|nr:hypothetical protein [Actinomadura verrucosospora]QKG24373.1 hypothetical protein ACTIVE_6020 [Actinomadura verrucosospora]
MGRVARPGRPAAPVPDPDSPLGRFARGLRDLRDRAGAPSFRALAQETRRLGTPYSETSLRNAASGRVPPSWELTEAYVRACAASAERNPAAGGAWDTGALLTAWTTRWRALGDAPPDDDPPPDDPPGNLRPALTSFVGRERELAEGAALLAAGRLVTLTGVGGAGKTRLALRLARDVAGRFPGGVWLAELAGLTEPASRTERASPTEPSMAARAVATALGVQVDAGRDPLDAVAETLRGRPALLVLDNCEHLLAEAAALARALLRAAPALRVLATAREPLAIAGERLLAVGPLPLPDGDDRSAAVDLFTDRATAAVPGFRLTDANRAAVVRVCRMLEGLPLALELAAPRLRLLSLDDLLDRLDQRLVLLGASAADRTAHPRHRTLRAVFDWSHDLCAPAERLAWERLSVCAGGVSLADAEALCGPHAFEAIAGLVDKSLLTRTDVAGRTRLHMLETVRLYGLERLAASGGEDAARDRHRDRYLGLARDAEAGYATSRQPACLARLREEHPNLRQALARTVTGDPSAAALDGASCLWLYWVACGNVAEGAHWTRRLAERHPSPPDAALAPAWCRTAWTGAFVLLLNGDHAGSADLLARCEAALDGPSGGLRAAVHQLRGLAALFTGDTEAAERHSLAALDEGGFHPALLTDQQALAQLGMALAFRGARAEAEEHILRALGLAERRGESWHRSYLLWILAIEYEETGRSGKAIAPLRRSLALKHRLGDRLGAATVSETLAWLLARHGDPRTAARLLGAAADTWQPAGAPQLWGFEHLVGYRARSIARIRRMLGDTAFDREFRHGARTGLMTSLTQVLPPLT